MRLRACVGENGLKKGAWSEEEDNKLRAYVARYGHWNWRQLPKFAGLARCGKSCRLRWVNYIKPGIKRGNYSKEEEDLIVQLNHELGNKWSAIAEKLPGRTASDIKNHWYSNIRKRSRRTSTISKVAEKLPVNFMQDSFQNSDQETASLVINSEEFLQKLKLKSPEASDQHIHILEPSSGSDSWINNLVAPVNCDSDDSTSSSPLPDHQEVWSFLSEKTNYHFFQDQPLPDHQEVWSLLSEQTNYQLFQDQLNVERVYFEEPFWTEPFVVDNSYGQEDGFLPVDEGGFFSFDLLAT